MDLMIHSSTFLLPDFPDNGFSLLYSLVVLNQPLPKFTPLLWNHARFRVCADGGANHLYDEFPQLFPDEDAFAIRKRYKPDVIKGDMDSIRAEVLEFYSNMGTKTIDASHDQDSTDFYKCVAYIRDLPNLDKQNNTSSRLHDRSKETSKTLKQLSRLFPNKVTIQIPEDETVLLDWKQQLDRDIETMKSQSIVGSIRSVLNRIGLDCPDLETLCIKDQALTSESVEKIVGWALIHQLMHCSEASVEQSKLVISSENIRHGLNILQGIQNENKSVKKSLKDVVTENEFEKRLHADVIPPGEIGVTFDDIGALENVKDTLKELVMLPLQRPELFSKGRPTKPCKGILLFGPPGTDWCSCP